MLDVMAAMSASWRDLDEVWPWSRVLRAHEAVVRQRYYHAHPTAYLHSSFIAANIKKGRKAPKPTDLILPGALPPELKRETSRAEAVYSERIVAAFTLARSLGLTGNAHLAAFGTDELRASGWTRGDG